MRRHFRQFREIYKEDFGEFLTYTIENSDCDKKIKEHFRYYAGGYQFEGDHEAFQQEIDA